MRDTIAAIIKKALGNTAPVELTVPEEAKFGHYSTNVAMRLAKERGKSPIDLANEFVGKIKHAAPAGFFENIEAVAPGFVNLWLSKKTLQEGLADIARKKDFGKNKRGERKKVIVEYSSVNIAKAMNLGHFRTTIIGDALANVLAWSGYDVVRWNYLGDWGTQFGKLIAAYNMWGNDTEIEKNPVEELQKLYVRFHEEAKVNSEFEKRGQEEFQKLESGDAENRKLWEWFKKESLVEFKKIYEELDVNFDVWIGESFFNNRLKTVARELVDKNIAGRSEGALVVKLDEFNLPAALIEKSDGASLYLTRDIANLEYRLQKYHPSKILYVVANEQALHFEQLFAIAKLMKLDSAELTHVKYGLVLGDSGKKLSTREGRSVSVAQAMEKAVSLARRIVEEKNADLDAAGKDQVARAVGLGALKYNDLKENRTTDIVFDWEKMLDFSGDSGPYVQYTHARLKSILRKAGWGGVLDFFRRVSASGAHRRFDSSLLETEHELALVRKILEFPDVVARAGDLYATSVLAAYLYKLAVAANKFYETTPILKDETSSRRAARLVLADVAARTIKSGLAILGISAPEQI